MANFVSIPFTEKIFLIVQRVTPAYVYENRQRTEKRVVNDLGQPITRVAGIGVAFSDFRELTLEVPDHMIQDIAPKDCIFVGGLKAIAEMSARDFDMSVKVKGIDYITKYDSTALELWEEIIAEAGEEK